MTKRSQVSDMKRGEVRRVQPLDQLALVIGDDFDSEGLRQARIAPIRLGHSELHSSRELKLLNEAGLPSEQPAFIEFWNARQVPTRMLSEPLGSLGSGAVAQVVEYLRSEIFGEPPNLPPGSIGDAVAGHGDRRYRYQTEEAAEWDVAARRARVGAGQAPEFVLNWRVNWFSVKRSIFSRQSASTIGIWDNTFGGPSRTVQMKDDGSVHGTSPDSSSGSPSIVAERADTAQCRTLVA